MPTTAKMNPPELGDVVFFLSDMIGTPALFQVSISAQSSGDNRNNAVPRER